MPEAENYINWRLNDMSVRNEHHRFEEIATRVARRRISMNIQIATGPVSAGGDQQRDAETYRTRIPDELPNASGFAASTSTSPIVVACTVQREGLRGKVLADLEGICAPNAAQVEHVVFFSVHAISEGVTHELQRIARETHGVELTVFCGSDIATELAQPDLVWVAQYYLDLPASMVPVPIDGDPHPEWYSDLLDNLRRNGGPAALTPATQGEVTQGMRHATWDDDARADLPEWLDFMSAFLAHSDEGVDTDLVFRACYEMAVAKFRGLGVAAGTEDLVRRAMDYARSSAERNVVDDATTLASYWGVMWITGVAEAEAAEIADALDRLRDHTKSLLAATDPATHPVRAAALTGTLAFAYLVPDWRKAEALNGRPARAERAANAGVQLREHDVDASGLFDDDLVDIEGAMGYLEQLVDLMPRARAYSVRQLAAVFTMYVTAAVSLPSYEKVRDGLDAAVSAVQGHSAIAERCRDRGTAFAQAGQPLRALVELHNAKANWFNGDTLYGSILTMRLIGALYSSLGLVYAAKMYATAAAAIAVTAGDVDVEEHVPKALLEAASYAQQAGTWVDAAGLTEVAFLARAQLLPEPFDSARWPELGIHESNAMTGLAAIRTFWPNVEPLVEAAHSRTEWYDHLVDGLDPARSAFNFSEEEFQERAKEQLAGPILGDLGSTRIIDFQALGVRWVFEFNNDQTTVLTAEGFVATLQVLLAEVALHHPVLIGSTVRVHVTVMPGAERVVDDITIDDSGSTVVVEAVLSNSIEDVSGRDVAVIAHCFQLLHAVHARPPVELQDLLEPLFRNGLPHKVSVGRPYEETAALLDHHHYSRCGSIARPESSAGFTPVTREPMASSTRLGTGYDARESLQAIRERYEVAFDTLRFTLPRGMADDTFTARVVGMREAGWLDWQILVMLGNAKLNWRMRREGVQPGVGDPRAMARIGRSAETSDSPLVPLEVFTSEQFDVHVFMLPAIIGQRWGLRTRQELPGEEAMRDLLIRRYRFAEDDLPHVDLLHCVDADGNLKPFMKSAT